MSALKTNKRNVGILFVLRESHDVDMLVKKTKNSAWVFADMQYTPYLVEYSKNIIDDIYTGILK